MSAAPQRLADPATLADENAHLRARLREAEDTLHALRHGEVDAIVVGQDVYVLEAAQVAQGRFRGDVVAQMNDAVLLVDLENHLLFLNPAAERQYGVPASGALGLPLDRLYEQRWLAPDDEAAMRAALHAHGTWQGRSRHVLRSGRALLVESTLSLLREPGGTVAGVLAVVRDVTERAAAEAALRESRERLAFTLDASDIGDWELDLDTLAARRSLRHDECFGYTEAVTDWTHELFRSLVHPEDVAEVDRRFREAVEHTGKLDFECRVIWPDGSVHWIESHGRLWEKEGRRHLLGIVWEITDRKQAEAVLRDADQRKDEFIAVLAHELRNPLAPIRNALQILQLSDTPTLKQHAIEVIDRQLKQVVHLVDDLLEVSRITQGKLLLRRERLQLAAVMRAAAEASQATIERKRHALHLTLPADDVCVEADETRLIQVLCNLLDNAAKYTPEGGRIELSAQVEGEAVRIRVADNGIGIAAPLLPRVFDMFMQIGRGIERAQGGLGIGLALVKRLVEMHGGRVEAQSEGEQRGTTMAVTLPLAAARDGAPSDAAARSSMAKHASGKGLRVLVIDDNHDNAESLRTVLDVLGYETAIGHDGEEAVALAERFRPHLVLLDLGLPRIDGYEAGRRIRDREWGREMTLVALTGWGQHTDRQRSREAGFDHHFVKPVEPARIVELLDQIAAKRG